MLLVISPAKSLEFDTKSNAGTFTQPIFSAESKRIIDVLKKKSVKKLMDLQGISQSLAELNFFRNQEWIETHTLENAKQAISAFSGDVYVGLNESDFTAQDYEYSQDHLRILSGLYGVLKPLDLMQPYRLEMGTRLSNPRGKNLYEFWKLRITEAINEDLDKTGSHTLVNLASDEYFSAIKPKKLKGEIIQPVFMDKSKGKYKVVSFFAKKARGMMVRFAVKNKLTNIEELKAFEDEGYLYNAEMSIGNKWLFTRNQE